METESDKIHKCYLRGKFKKDLQHKRDKLLYTDIAVVGDEVEYSMPAEGAGMISEVFPRKNYISRKAPRLKGAGVRGERLEQVICSNIDLLLIIASVTDPVFNNKVVDRFLVSAESSHINAVIIINKTDLGMNEDAEYFGELYKILGYKVIFASAVTGEGTDAIRKLVKNKRVLFWGHSGVGKSSLINYCFPQLDLRVGEISTYNFKGKHTTVIVNMNRIDKKTFIIDSPGIREIDPFGITKEDLCHYFREFEKYLGNCRYYRCTHHHEPGCAIIEALEKEEIAPERYESYLRILDTVEDDML